MAKAYIELTEANIKAIKNFIGMCRMNGMENSADPTFTFKDQRDTGNQLSTAHCCLNRTYLSTNNNDIFSRTHWAGY